MTITTEIRYVRAAFDMLVDFAFDDVGRVSSVTYPEVDGSRLEVRYVYDSLSGVLTRIESDGLEVDWELISHDGYLRTLAERAGGARIDHEYDPVFGIETRTQVRQGTSATSPLLHDVDVLLSLDGNVRLRRDNLRGRVETFGYDRRDRLVGWTSVTGTGSSRLERRVNHTYSDGGRLLSVTDRQQFGSSGTFSTVAAESYVYEPGVRGAGPRAATEQIVVSGSSSSSTLFGYESGRQTAAGGRAVSYTHFDLPAVVSDSTTRIYDYDASRHRARVRQPQGETVVYAGSFFERRMSSTAAAENIVFVYGPGGLVAQLRRADGAPAWSTEYVHGDHLGSATVTTDPAGNIVSEQWFGPFGRRLDGQGRDLPRGTGVPEALRVGFTGHEQEDAVGLVDMQGRFYDPTQRRFLTADPIIANPQSTQAFSPYAYVDNNPLSRIDPTGFYGESADENGFMDEGDWDLTGLDDQGDAPSGGGGGGGPGDDDFDGGDIDFDGGEAMAGQDEEASNDGTDDYHASGSKQGRGVEGWFFSRAVLDNWQEANGRSLVHELATVAYGEFAIAIHRSRGARGDTLTAYDMADMADEIRGEIRERGGSVRDWEGARNRWLAALSGGGPPVVQATARQSSMPELVNGTMAYAPAMGQIVVRSDAGAGQFRWTVEGMTPVDLERAAISGSAFFQLDHELVHPQHPEWRGPAGESRVVDEVNGALAALGLPTRQGYTTMFRLGDNAFQWVVPQNVR